MKQFTTSTGRCFSIITETTRTTTKHVTVSLLLLLLLSFHCTCFVSISKVNLVVTTRRNFDNTLLIPINIHQPYMSLSNNGNIMNDDNDNDDSENDDDDDDEELVLLQNISEPPEGIEINTHDELMYTLGVNLARQLGDITPLVDNGNELALVAKGLLDTIVGRLTDDGQRQLLQRRGLELNTLITQRAQRIRDALAEAGRDMLEQMSQINGVIKLDTGVIIQKLESSTNEKEHIRPTKSSTVQIHYHGTLADGTIFDSTLGKESVKFPLANVIPGWRDGVLKMYQGDVCMIGIPPDQAYGSDGTPDGRIPGNSTLFFKIELLNVLSAGITDENTNTDSSSTSSLLLGADGRQLSKSKSTTLLGPDGKPLF